MSENTEGTESPRSNTPNSTPPVPDSASEAVKLSSHLTHAGDQYFDRRSRRRAEAATQEPSEKSSQEPTQKPETPVAPVARPNDSVAPKAPASARPDSPSKLASQGANTDSNMADRLAKARQISQRRSGAGSASGAVAAGAGSAGRAGVPSSGSGVRKPNVPKTPGVGAGAVGAASPQKGLLDAKKDAAGITKKQMGGAEKSESDRLANARAVKDAQKNPVKPPTKGASALAGIKGSAANAAKSYRPAKVQKSNGQNDTAANAKNTVGSSAVKGAVAGAVKGAATGGWAGAAAGAARGAATGAAQGSKKAAIGAAADTAANSMTKSRESSETTARVGKGATMALVMAFGIALLSGSIGGIQQGQQQQGFAMGKSAGSQCEVSAAPATNFGGQSIYELASVNTRVPAAIPDLSEDQIKNVKTIIGFAKTVNLGKEGAIIGIMTAMTESTLRNIDYGDDVGPDSRGLFQQRYQGGWGSEADIANTTYATQAFYFGAGTNPGLTNYEWKTYDPWVAAQKVQRSAFSDGRNYREHYETAKEIVAKYYNQSPGVQPLTDHGLLKNATEVVSVETPAADCEEASEGGAPILVGGGQGNNDYPAARAPYCRVAAGCPWIFGVEAGYGIQCASGVAGGCRGECVDWAGWRALQKMDAVGKFKIVWGNANTWDDNARANGHIVDKTPEVGALVNWEAGMGGSGSAGHIATISKVHANGTFDIEEYNYGEGNNASADPMKTGTPGRYNTRQNITVAEVSNIIHINSTKGFSPV